MTAWNPSLANFRERLSVSHGFFINSHINSLLNTGFLKAYAFELAHF